MVALCRGGGETSPPFWSHVYVCDRRTQSLSLSLFLPKRRGRERERDSRLLSHHRGRPWLPVRRHVPASLVRVFQHGQCPSQTFFGRPLFPSVRGSHAFFVFHFSREICIGDRHHHGISHSVERSTVCVFVCVCGGLFEGMLSQKKKRFRKHHRSDHQLPESRGASHRSRCERIGHPVRKCAPTCADSQADSHPRKNFFRSVC